MSARKSIVYSCDPLEDTLFPETVTSKGTHFPSLAKRSRFGRVPWEVTSDRRIHDRDVRLYAALASFCHSGQWISAGLRWMADSVNASTKTVRSALKRLQVAGHIEIIALPHGKRQQYRLLSAVFERRDAEPQVQPDRPKRVLPPRSDWPVCPVCDRRRPHLEKTGRCAQCRRDKRTERIAEKVYDRRTKESA